MHISLGALGDDRLAAIARPNEPASPGGLTKREVEILVRIASGATNKQVASQIFISEKTVGRHLANIYSKLGVSSRTAAVTWGHLNNVLHLDD